MSDQSPASDGSQLRKFCTSAEVDMCAKRSREAGGGICNCMVGFTACHDKHLHCKTISCFFTSLDSPQHQVTKRSTFEGKPAAFDSLILSPFGGPILGTMLAKSRNAQRIECKKACLNCYLARSFSLSLSPCLSVNLNVYVFLSRAHALPG